MKKFFARAPGSTIKAIANVQRFCDKTKYCCVNLYKKNATITLFNHNLPFHPQRYTCFFLETIL